MHSNIYQILVCLSAFASGAMGASPPWGVTSVQSTGVPTSQSPVLSQNGEIFFRDQTFVKKRDSGGRDVFATAIPGADKLSGIQLGLNQDVYVTGGARYDFVPTPGVFGSAPFGYSPAFVCKLGAIDGSLIFCTYLNVDSLDSLRADPSGNLYVTGGSCSNSLRKCIQKISSDASQLMYERSLDSLGVGESQISIASIGSSGDVLLSSNTIGSFVLARVSPVGDIQSSRPGGDGESVAVSQTDSLGNLEIAVRKLADRTYLQVRKYDASLVNEIFRSNLRGFTPLQMLIGSDNATLLLGETIWADLPQVHPTATCSLVPTEFPPAGNYLPPASAGVMMRLDNLGNLTQSTYLPGPGAAGNGFLQSDTAVFLSTDWDPVTHQAALLNLGSATEVRIGCLSNSATLRLGALAPSQIVSLFGQNIGPVEPAFGQPGTNGVYPNTLAGTRVTFDGALAPEIYVSASQLNVVTPQSLNGKNTTDVCVQVLGETTNCINAPVQPSSPGVFASGEILSDAIYYAAAINQDGTVNSRDQPAPLGSVVSVFGTGLGLASPAAQDGSTVEQPLPTQTLPIQLFTFSLVSNGKTSVSPNYLPVTVQYAGPAPGQISGLSQINFLVPPNGNPICVQAGSGNPGTACSPQFAIWRKP